MIHKKLRSTALTAAAVICMVLGSTGAVLGAEESIKSVSVSVTSSVEADTDLGNVSAESSSSRYHVASCEFVSSKDSWKAGEIPRVNIVLEADEGYYFNTITSGKATIHGATYVTAKKSSDNGSLTLTVKLKAVKGTLGLVEDAYWETTPLGKAKWTKVDNASAYQVRLYHGDNMIYQIDKTSQTTCDFFPKMTRRGDYYFKVRAIAKSETEDEYVTDGEWMESNNQEITLKDATAAEERGASSNNGNSGSSKTAGGPQYQAPGWVQDGNGWWYKNTDDTYPVNRWQEIGGKWYLFDMNGYILTGWQTKNEKEYYLTSNGDMVVGWFQNNRQWYYLDPEQGKISGGWLNVADEWYYMNPDGTMASGWVKTKGNWYYLNPANGRMVKDTTVEKFYINSDGVWIP